MNRPSALWLTVAAVAVGYLWGWLLPQCLDRVVREATTRARWGA